MKLVARDWLESQPKCWVIEDNRILRSDPTNESSSLILAPAFHDIQVNGGGGVSFTSDRLRIEDVYRVVRLHQAQGTGSFFPTVITARAPTMLHSLRTLREAVESSPSVANACPGFHLEGPMISPDDGYRGAHPMEHVRSLSIMEFEELQAVSGGRIKLLTLAPEVPGAMEIIPQLVGQGVRVSLGHTKAKSGIIHEAVEAGATFSTHLGNGIARELDRHENPLWAQLADNRLTASIIADGHHLSADIVRVIARVKIPHLVLISDASSYVGCPPGTYQDWGATIEVMEDNRVTLAGTPYLAGSGAFLRQCVEWAIRHSFSCTTAISCAGQTPYTIFDLPCPTNRVVVDESGAALDPLLRGLLDATRVV